MHEKAIHFNLFSSRLARRILITFVACALIPVVVLAGLALYQVSHQLESQAHQRLRQAAKSHGLSIYEHLLFCEDELKLVGLGTARELDQQRQKFDAMGRHYPDGRYESILGDPIQPIPLSDQARTHLAQGNTLLFVRKGETAQIILARFAGGDASAPVLLLGAVHSGYLWGIEKGNLLPPLTEFAVFGHHGVPLYRSTGWPPTLAAVAPQLNHAQYRVKASDTHWFAAGWPLFLKPAFAAESWSIEVLQPQTHVLAPIAQFKRVFVLVVILALMLVVILSLFTLRRSLGPIQALKTGARRIARREFDHRVAVDGKDEFRELAQCFNDMSDQLGQQFQFLSTQAKIDQATLMAYDFTHIAGLSISRILKDFPFRMVAIGRVNVDDPDDALVFIGFGKYSDTVTSQPFTIDAEDLGRFDRDLPWKTITDHQVLGKYLPKKLLKKWGAVTLFPVFVKNRLFALLAVAGHPPSFQMDSALPLMRQIADHLAVAWSNVSLIRDLRRLTLGSLQALARAVDAKSPWTAGHSARVMRVAMGIARQMGLEEDRIDRLQQAALIHDIGKIGIRASILDKPGKLTDEEFDTIRQHPAIGDTILSPINAFRRIIPLVRQHHERWDGKGYPDGLAGEAITLEARILAVADVYDAMVSDRPYRRGMTLDKVLSIIASEAGRQFDPEVVAAFMEMMAHKKELAA